MLKKILFLLSVCTLLLTIFHQDDGTRVLQKGATKGSLKIFRDHKGIAHIVGNNTEDIVYGQGYSQAHDRLWTLHVKKRILEGRLSEILGPETVPLDIYLRNLNLMEFAELNALSMDDFTRRHLESYCRGMNDYARSLKVLPIEFYLFWTDWQDFTPINNLATIGLFSMMLQFDWMFQIARERLKQSLGMELAMKLIPCSSEDLFEQVTIVKDEELKDMGLFKEYDNSKFKKTIMEHWGRLKISLPQLKMPELTMTTSGSNAWIIGGKHTDNNLNILANDPHVGLALPTLFYPYEAILVDDNNQVVNQAFGVTMDGLPGLSIGMNKYFAWGSTSQYADSKDIFVEDILVNEDGSKSYLYNGKYIPLRNRTDTIKVRGSSDRNQTYYFTHRGPIISSVFMDLHFKYGFPMPKHHESMLSLNAAPFKSDNGTSIKSLILFMFPKTLDEYKEYAKYLKHVNINSVWISKQDQQQWGFTPLGLIQKKKIPEMGSFIKNGTTDQYESLGPLEFHERPLIVNPKKGYVAMTNNKMTSNNYVYQTNMHEISNGRSARLDQIINSKIAKGEKFTFEDMMKMQLDTKDYYVQKMLKSLLKLWRDNKEDWIDRQFIEKILVLLDKWDSTFDKNSIQASIYSIWEHEFQLLLLLDRGLTESQRLSITCHAFFEIFYFNLIKRLSTDTKTTQEDIKVCQNQYNKLSQKNPCIANMIIALNKLEKSMYDWFGTGDESSWQWGKIHQKSFTFIPWTELPGIGRFWNRKMPADGNSRTLNVGIHTYQKKNFETFATATFRLITDFNRTVFGYDMGVSDSISSPYYDNFAKEFNDGIYTQYVPINPMTQTHNWTLSYSTDQIQTRVGQSQDTL